MAIFLGKQYLGQMDRQENDTGVIDLSEFAKVIANNYTAEK